MSVASLDPSAMLNRALEFAASNLTIERLLIQIGLDPNNVTYQAIFDRLLDLVLANITFASVLALIGGIFLILSFMARTIVPMRLLCIVSIVFFLGAAMLAGSVQHFLMYFLALPANVVRLVQIRGLVKRARSSARGSMSLDWLRPYMTPRQYKKGDVLFRKDDVATEMFLTVTGKFRVTEIDIEIPAGRILGELGFLSPKNRRTQSVECIEDGEVLTIGYDRLRTIYLQNPEFGYYFLRLTSDRLIQNYARLEGIAEQGKAALTAADAANQAGGAIERGKKSRRSVFSIINEMRVARVRASQGSSASGAMRSLALGHVIALIPKWTADPAVTENASQSSASAEIAAARRRARALAIVERHANFSGAGGFIPLPIVNIATIMTVLVRMVRALSRLYGVPFERNRAYSLVIGLLGGVMPTRLATAVTVTMISFVPGANLFGLAVTSVSASAYARTIGRRLIDHFERQAALERRATQHLASKRGRRWAKIWPLRLAKPAKQRTAR